MTRAKLLKYSMYSSGKSEETTIGQRVSKKRMHCASLCCMAIELKGFMLSILGKIKEGDVLMLTVVVSLCIGLFQIVYLLWQSVYHHGPLYCQ